jgi:hypothetical protein
VIINIHAVAPQISLILQYAKFMVIFLFQEGTGLDHFLNNFKGRKQPVILVLGGTYRKPGQSYVILERKAYPCASLVGAVDLGYKVFQILDLCYPPQASGIWSFFDLIV